MYVSFKEIQAHVMDIYLNIITIVCMVNVHNLFTEAAEATVIDSAHKLNANQFV